MDWYDARVNAPAGYRKLRDAARLLGIRPEALSMVEHGKASPLPELVARMRLLYAGIEPERPALPAGERP